MPSIEPRDLVGLWKGRGIPAGHPFDGVLENLGWFGKRSTPNMRADALLFRSGEHRLRKDDYREKPVFLSSAPSAGEGSGRFAEDHRI